MKGLKKVALALALTPMTGLANLPAQAEPQPDVVMFTQAHCPPCLAAMAYLEEKDIAYRYFDIEASARARDVFERLGGRGTPLILIDGKRLQGFSRERFELLYERAVYPRTGRTERSD